MDRISSLPVRGQVAATRRGLSRGRSVEERGRGETRGLRMRVRASGTSVSGPAFCIWDEEHARAVGWARELAELWDPADPAPRRIPHVLLAEDDPDFRSVLADAFRRSGYQLTTCVDGPDLLSRLGSDVLFGPSDGFDLVVSDIRMPGATALEILEALQGCTGMPPVVLISAFPSATALAAARRLGVAAFFEKPFEVEKLIQKVDELLGSGPGEPH